MEEPRGQPRQRTRPQGRARARPPPDPIHDADADGGRPEEEEEEDQLTEKAAASAASRSIEVWQLGDITADPPVEWVGPGDEDYIDIATHLPTMPIEFSLTELHRQPPLRRLWHQEGAYIAVSDVPRASAKAMVDAVDKELYDNCVRAGAEQAYPPRGSRYVMRGGAVSEGGGHENRTVNAQRGSRYFTPPEEDIQQLPAAERRAARAALSRLGIAAQPGARFGRHLYPRRFAHADDPAVEELYEGLDAVYSDAARAVTDSSFVPHRTPIVAIRTRVADRAASSPTLQGGWNPTSPTSTTHPRPSAASRAV